MSTGRFCKIMTIVDMRVVEPTQPFTVRLWFVNSNHYVCERINAISDDRTMRRAEGPGVGCLWVKISR